AAARRTARLPPAPGWLSTNTCCFQLWVSPWATIRKATSGVLPAEESVIICTGLFGYGPVCPSASAMAATASNHASTKVQLVFIRLSTDLYRACAQSKRVGVPRRFRPISFKTDQRPVERDQ